VSEHDCYQSVRPSLETINTAHAIGLPTLLPGFSEASSERRDVRSSSSAPTSSRPGTSAAASREPPRPAAPACPRRQLRERPSRARAEAVLEGWATRLVLAVDVADPAFFHRRRAGLGRVLLLIQSGKDTVCYSSSILHVANVCLLFPLPN
jgi:hypothetical protein